MKLMQLHHSKAPAPAPPANKTANAATAATGAAIFQNAAKLVSLGGNCSIALWLRDRGHQQPINFFDWLGTPSWAIEKVLATPTYRSIFSSTADSGSTVVEDAQQSDLDNPVPPLYNEGSAASYRYSFDGVRMHSSLFITFPHDRQRTEADLIATYNRRLERFYQDILDDSKTHKTKPVLFLRFELNDPKWLDLELNPFLRTTLPSLADRAANRFHAKKHEIEKDHIQQLSRHLRRLFPTLFFKILYLSQHLSDPFAYDDDPALGILYVRLPPFSPPDQWELYSAVIDQAIRRQQATIERHLLLA